LDNRRKVVSDPASVPFSRRFWPLVALGLAGVASLPLVMLPTLRFLVRNGQAPGMSIETLAALSLIQPALLLIAGAAVGAALAPSLGFTSHVAKVNVRAPWGQEVPLAVASGLVIGLVIVGVDIALFGHAASPAPSMSARAIVDGLVGGVLYGGLTEEIMMRWGLMSFVAWAFVRLFARHATVVSPAIFVVAIVIVALLFAAGHLPAAAMMSSLSAGMVGRILLLNGVAGLLFGWLFWRRSLESAMAAHASVHVVFALAQVLGWG
jgi:membrane protease YdiL (CAAX protease family)